MNGFKRICAVIVGTVFFVAGVLKLMDPLGTALIVEEYLNFFHLSFLMGAAKVLGVFLGLVESCLGAALITGVWRKAVAWTSFGVLGFFTAVTLVLWIANPAMDCGCFGEALHLEHWQSFVKNIALLGLLLIAFVPLKKAGEPQRIKYVSFAISIVAIALFTLYSSLSIPLADYTSLKPGTELYGAFDENFDDITAAVYEKNGHTGAFTPDCPPDTSWHFVRYENYDRNIVDDQAPSQILSFYDASGQYADSLALKGQVMVISAYAPEKLSGARREALASFATDAKAAGFEVIFLVAGTPEDIQITELPLVGGTYFADRRTLMTLNRSNGGVTYIYDGQITSKWAARAVPDKEKLGSIHDKDAVEFMLKRGNKGKISLQGFLLYTFAVMVLL